NRSSMKKPLFIAIAAVLAVAAMALSWLALRQSAPKAVAGVDELKVRSELIAKNMGRTLSDPLANKDDLALSEQLAQAKSDFPEVDGVIVVNLRDQVVAASDEGLAGTPLALPEGAQRLSAGAIPPQPLKADQPGQRIYWTAVPVLLGKERIGAVYLRTTGAAGTAAPAPFPLPLAAGQAAALLLLLALIVFALPRGEVKVVASADNAKVEEERAQLVRELDTRRKELRKVEAEAADHNRWLEMFRAEENDLAAQVKKMREERAELDGKTDSGRKQLIEFESLLREKQQKLEEVSHSLTARIQEGMQLDQRLDAVQKQEAELNTRMTELKKGEENLASWLKNSKVEVQNLVRFIAEKRVEESELEQLVDEIKAELAGHQKRSEQLRSEVEELTGICEQLSTERTRLTQEVSEKQQNLTAVMKLLEGSRSRLDKLQKQETATGSK
ncbi:MAG TPA: hypothetical protein VMF29_00610, partial [Candidatus Edwardsbacteria bacterium]|nr:hypothetical protein [Candidatus Edwardsbacteria bacterium]